ncbi:hypothetical protein A3L04_01930 [Thermococcus chitonophagus]|uniref:ECF transporter S component n=1 Tax=Thermococcus chitonophagus TaxID=54262 RepID=A0A160VQV7_9EURY|nr:ECF transporter S component [Thermococcus chitonophagus]ASJ15919.1 hypothetical protein A3L04_01930 [Thermococcus chitonophagus]CUX77162.1 hypothetical protein CHITON_0383 [Thermococcus chitonophagus]
MRNAKVIAFSALMAALSLILQVLPLKVRTPWGMSIDLVAVPIITLYFILGFQASVFGLIVMTIGLFIISGPHTMGIGPIMKFFATLSVILGLKVTEYLVKDKGLLYITMAFLISAIIRDILMIVLNYYFALPLYLKMMGYNITSRTEVIKIVEEMTKTPFWLAIALPNTIQTAVDIFVALPIARKASRLQ